MSIEALRVDDLAIIEGDVREMHIGFDNEQTRHLRTLDDLHGVEDTHERKVPGEGNVGPTTAKYPP